MILSPFLAHRRFAVQTSVCGSAARLPLLLEDAQPDPVVVHRDTHFLCGQVTSFHSCRQTRPYAQVSISFIPAICSFLSDTFQFTVFMWQLFPKHITTHIVSLFAAHFHSLSLTLSSLPFPPLPNFLRIPTSFTTYPLSRPPVYRDLLWTLFTASLSIILSKSHPHPPLHFLSCRDILSCNCREDNQFTENLYCPLLSLSTDFPPLLMSPSTAFVVGSDPLSCNWREEFTCIPLLLSTLFYP